MRKFKLFYSDKEMSARDERFEIQRPLTMPEAKELADALAIMGCSDFEYVPVRAGA